ncbi:MAG: laccase domain-containing protein, partial [Luminiphilus sp.]
MNTDPPLLAPEIGIEGVMIRVSTRRGGVSAAPWDSLNLGDHVGDQPAHVAENRRRLQRALSVPAISWLRQVHGTRVIKAVDGTRHEADAQWTEQRGRALAILTADCLPVVLIA